MGKIIYDKENRVGDFLKLDLMTGKSYILTFNQDISKFITPKDGVFKIAGTDKKVVYMGCKRSGPNMSYTDVKILIPAENPFPVLIAVYALCLLVAGIAVKLGTDNIVKISEDVTEPLPLLVIAGFGAMYFYLKTKG